MNIENIIEEKNLKITSARKELLEIFYKSKKPVSFEDIKELINMDKATFYRNVIKFEEQSILSSFEANDRKKYYEINENPHSHFICNNCNIIECLKDVQTPKINGYKISSMILKGLCQECNTEKVK